jgi:molecular chaperone DnaK
MAISNRIYGIDLGTTNSCIAYVDDDGLVQVLPGDVGNVTPSVVWFKSPTEIVVGMEARRVRSIFPSHVVDLVKRHIAEKDRKRSPGETEWFTEQYGVKWTAEGISALIVKKLVDDAYKNRGLEVEDVLITVPQSFGTGASTATENAARGAGVNPADRLLPEPSAAAFAYSKSPSTPREPLGDGVNLEGETVLVYDLGGGTFDAAVARLSEGHVEIIWSEGDSELGGQNWDDAFANLLLEKWKSETRYQGADPFETQTTYYDFSSAAEDAKIRLTESNSVPVTVGHNGELASIEVTRAEFDRETLELLDGTIELTREAIRKAEENNADPITRFLLTGGSSHMPQVREALVETFDLPVSLYYPEEAVARGAALYADEHQRGGPKTISNACSKSFGLVLFRDLDSDERIVKYLIKKGSPVPTTEVEHRSVTHTDDSNVRITVVEGNGNNLVDGAPCLPDFTADRPYLLPDAVREISRMTLIMPRGLPAGTPVLNTFYLSPDGGRLWARAEEQTGGGSVEVQNIEVDALTEDQISELQDMIEDGYGRDPDSHDKEDHSRCDEG